MKKSDATEKIVNLILDFDKTFPVLTAYVTAGIIIKEFKDTGKTRFYVQSVNRVNELEINLKTA